MKVEKIRLRDALTRGRELPWALVRSLGSVTLGQPPVNISEDELLEARFFSADEEIRIFRYEDELRSVLIQDGAADEFVERTYAVSNPELGTEITVRTYLGFDDDGQAYPKTSRLTGWKGGHING